MYECTAILLSVSNAERILLLACLRIYGGAHCISQTMFDLDSMYCCFCMHLITTDVYVLSSNDVGQQYSLLFDTLKCKELEYLVCCGKVLR